MVNCGYGKAFDGLSEEISTWVTCKLSWLLVDATLIMSFILFTSFHYMGGMTRVCCTCHRWGLCNVLVQCAAPKASMCTV